MNKAHSERIAILGLGREGHSALAWVQQTRPDAEVWLFDEDMSSSLPDRGAGAAKLKAGPIDKQALTGFDQIIKSPGIPLLHPAVDAARNAGVPVTSGTNLWFEAHGHRRTIGITGTKGKSTTASLIAHLLEQAGEPVELAGNVGRPLLEVDVDTPAWVVVEFSSYQLADFRGELQLGLLLNVFSEHLDWHGSQDDYRAAKFRLLEQSRQGLVGPQVLDRYPEWVGQKESRDEFKVIAMSRELVFQGQRIDPGCLPLRGDHNIENVRAALAVLDGLKIELDDAEAALATFQPLPHRLEPVAVVNGIRFVDDSISTTPQSTLAALRAYPSASAVLLVGGFDRGLDWQDVARELAREPPLAVIGLPDNGQQITDALISADVCPPAGIHLAENMDTAVRHAMRIAEERNGDLILLSPGAPSYGCFRDFKERGQAFRTSIRNL